MHKVKINRLAIINAGRMDLDELVGEVRSALAEQSYDLAKRLLGSSHNTRHPMIKILADQVPKLLESTRSSRFSSRSALLLWDNGVYQYRVENDELWSSRDPHELLKAILESGKSIHQNIPSRLVRECTFEQRVALGDVVTLDDAGTYTDPNRASELDRGTIYMLDDVPAQFVGVTRAGTIWFAYHGKRFAEMCERFDALKARQDRGNPNDLFSTIDRELEVDLRNAINGESTQRNRA